MFLECFRHKEKNVCKKCNPRRSEVVALLSEIRAQLVELRNEKPEEERAVASSAVKDRFVERTLSLVTEFNAKEFSSLDDIERLVSEIEHRLEEVRLSPREAMHVRFFFEESSARLASNMNGLARSVSAIRQIAEPLIQVRSSIDGLFRSYTEAREGIKSAEARIAELEKERAIALSRKITPKPFDPTGLNKFRSELKALEAKRDLVWQALDSYFSGADRILKKWAYVESDKATVELINRYLASPHAAASADSGFRIRDILVKALAKSEELKVEERDIIKTEALLSAIADGEIARLCQEEEQLSKQIEYVRQMLKSEEFLESQYRTDIESAKAVEKTLAEHLELEEKLRQKIATLDKESSRIKLQLEEALGKFLGQKIRIYDEVAAG